MTGIKLIQLEGVEVIFLKSRFAYYNLHLMQANSMKLVQLQHCKLNYLPVTYRKLFRQVHAGGMIIKTLPGLFENHNLQTESDSIAKRPFKLTEFLVHVLNIKL